MWKRSHNEYKVIMSIKEMRDTMSKKKSLSDEKDWHIYELTYTIWQYTQNMHKPKLDAVLAQRGEVDISPHP